jgi:crotonobetaine/carnitine-CoA ligase
MLPSHPEHVYVMLALAKLGATHIPVNVHHKAESLGQLLAHSGARGLIVDHRYADEAAPALQSSPVDVVVRRGAPGRGREGKSFENLLLDGSDRPVVSPPRNSDDVAMILYTSGTTGPSKGVMVTDLMYQTAARNAGIAAEARPGDVMFLWEPLHHVAGVQTVILCLQQGISCAMVERFSASRFWEQVRRYRATQIHYLGGVLGLLMKQPKRPDDSDNPVRIAYGAPAPPAIWTAFEKRFGVRIHECYGMTEASSFTTINLDGRVGSIGKPVAEFDVKIVDEDGQEAGPGKVGEIVQRERAPGYIMRGYLNDPAATAAALHNGWLHTGDLGRRDEDGYFYFCGRLKDTIRTRGENVSAWVVERAAAEFPGVEECAAIGVPSDIGEEDIKLFVRRAPGTAVDPETLVRYCESRLAYFEVPRYVEFIDAFPKTPSERIRKSELSRSVDCWDSRVARKGL